MWKLIIDCAAGDAVSARHVSAAAVAAVSVDGAALSLVTRPDRRSLVHASDELARLLDDQQFALGEGPCVQAWTSRQLVLAEDMSSAGSASRWPLFSSAALLAGARAMFGFPLQMGAIRLGTLDLYRVRPGMLSAEQLADALALCRAAVAMILATTHEAPVGTHPAARLGPPAEARIEVYQATGMISVQLNVSLEDAFAALRARAFTRGISLPDIARQVVDRKQQFSSGGPEGQ
jgi:hypothetical protein